MSNRHETGWNGIYHNRHPNSLPWELGESRELLVTLVDSGDLTPCKTLDLCCGVGTNPIYLATEGFTVTALDISDKAIEYAKDQASKKGVNLNFLVANFLKLPNQNSLSYSTRLLPPCRC
ncbi:MAG: class I SAM-dependent methyltransferase [Thermoproteota archaeon]